MGRQRILGTGRRQPRPGSLAVADQHPVASRADLRPIGLETSKHTYYVVQRVVVEVARSGADCAPTVAHTCTGLFPCRRKSLSRGELAVEIGKQRDAVGEAFEVEIVTDRQYASPGLPM